MLSVHSRLFIALIVCLTVSPMAQANDLTIAPSQPSVNAPKDASTEALPNPDRPEDSILAEDIELQNFDVWERIRKGYRIPDLNNPLVATHSTWYTARPEYLQRITQRASRYLFYVVQELEKRNMPTELALLPFIESAFNPQA